MSHLLPGWILRQHCAQQPFASRKSLSRSVGEKVWRLFMIRPAMVRAYGKPIGVPLENGLRLLTGVDWQRG
jgi:hypothetical protein